MRLPAVRRPVTVLLGPLLLSAGCAKTLAPYAAEYLEVYNHPTTAEGQVNDHHIVVVTIGAVFHEAVDIPPGQSQVFDILWPGHYRVDVEHDDGSYGSWQDPMIPVDINDAETTRVEFKY